MTPLTKYAVLGAIFTIVSCTRGPERHPEIAASAVCTDCQIDVTTVWSSRPRDPNVMAAGSYFEIDDMLWAMGEAAGHYITRFPLAGGPSSLVDRKGEGPGEFKYVDMARVHPAGDTIVVIGDPRLSVLTTTLDEIRSTARSVRSPRGMLVLRDGSILIVDPRARQPIQAEGFVLHETSATGEYVRSFRAAESTPAGGAWPLAFGYEEGTVWLIQPQASGFVAEQWHLSDGRRVRQLRVDPDWWVAESETPLHYEQVAQRGESVPRLPTGTVGAWDTGTHLWVALRHFDPDHVNDTFADYEPHDMFDGVLVAVDRTSGDLLASVVFDEFLFGFTNRGRIVLYDEDGSSNPRLKLMEPTLHRAAARETARPTEITGLN